jgi:hypothetical protein
MIAYELLAKLQLLTLCGQNEDGELEWIGRTQNWDALAIEEENILREYELSKI